MENGMDELDFLGMIEAENSNVGKIVASIESKDPEVRFRAVEKLGQLPCEIIPIGIIRDLLKSDPDELVKVQCLELMEQCADTGGMGEIRRASFDESWLVRGRAVLLLCKFGDDGVAGIIDERLLGELGEEEWVRYVVARLMISGDDLSEIEKNYDSLGYRARCALAHLLADLSCNERVDLFGEVVDFLNHKLHDEMSVAVRSSIESALRSMQE